MRADLLQDRIARGLGRGAAHLGIPHDLLRPRGPDDPLDPANRVMRLPAAFSAQDGKFARPNGYGPALWTGVFDTAYARVGDYLRGPSGIFFIAARQALLPVLCVQVNRTASLSRPAAPASAGANAYGGVSRAGATSLLGNWPASVLSAGGGERGELPSDANLPFWSVLLPVLPVTPRSADLVTDDLGRSFVVSTAEESALGWRLVVKQAAT